MKNYSILFAAILLACAASFTGYSQSIISIAGVGTEGNTGEGGAPGAAALNWPTSVAVDSIGDIFIADANNNIVRKIHNNIITTVAGTGFRAGTGYGDFSGDGAAATLAHLWFPSGVAADRYGNLYIADKGNNCIRKVDTGGRISTVAGIGGAANSGYTGDGAAAISAMLNAPTHVAVDTFGNVYIADYGNSAIRELTISSGFISTIAGTGVTGYGGDGGPAVSAQLANANDVAVDLAGNVYIADMYNNLIRKIDLTGTINSIAGTGISGFSGDGGPATAAYLFQPSSVAVDDSGNVYFSDKGNERVRMINAHDTISTLAGTGVAGYNGDGRPANTAKLWYPEGIAARNNHDVYLADRGNFRVRKITNSVVGIKNVNSSSASVAVFPNPSQGAFTININTDIEEQAQIVITNMAGEKVIDNSLTTNKPIEIIFDQPAGIYLLSAITAQGITNEKLIIK